jgi:two-component system chemotaxis response regulator CheY
VIADMNVLIVDDSRAMRMIIDRMLCGLGICDARQADSAHAGLAEVEREAPDLVLVDWHMPNVSGLDFIRAVRSEPCHYTGRLMMVTTETEIDRMGDALMSGADEYLMKPFTAEALADKLAIMGLVS